MIHSDILRVYFSSNYHVSCACTQIQPLWCGHAGRRLLVLLKLSFFANTFCCWWRFRRQWTNLKSFWCSPTLLAITEQSYEDFKHEDPNPHRTFLDTSQNVYKVSFLTPVLTFTFFSIPLNWHRVEFIAFY